MHILMIGNIKQSVLKQEKEFHSQHFRREIGVGSSNAEVVVGHALK